MSKRHLRPRKISKIFISYASFIRQLATRKECFTKNRKKGNPAKSSMKDSSNWRKEQLVQKRIRRGKNKAEIK